MTRIRGANRRGSAWACPAVANVVNDGGAGSGRSWQSQRASVIGDGRTGRSPATSPARTRDAPISGSPLRELRGYAATETARRGSRRGRGTGSAPNTPEVKTGALPDETARWKSSLRAEIRGENGRPRDSARCRQPRANHVADGREAAIDALIAEHEDALRTMKEEMDDERAEMIRSAERIRAEASEGVAQAAAQWLEERKFLNLRVDELETALRAAAEEAEAKRTEANEKFELEKAELRSRLESAVEEAAGKEAKMTERFAIEKGVEEEMESTRQEAAREVAAARDAQAREHERCKAEIERMTARMDEMREAHASEVREATEHLEIRLRQNEENAARRLEQQAAAWQQERESMESEAEATRVVLQTRLDAAKEDLSNYREHVEGKLVELREECDARGRRAREAREVAAEAESIRAEAVASAEAWRKEADLARAFAESARVDAEATLASERAAINEELEAMRAAHEIRRGPKRPTRPRGGTREGRGEDVKRGGRGGGRRRRGARARGRVHRPRGGRVFNRAHAPSLVVPCQIPRVPRLAASRSTRSSARGPGPYRAPRRASGFTSRARRGRHPARPGRTSAGSCRARGSRGPGAARFAHSSTIRAPNTFNERTGNARGEPSSGSCGCGGTRRDTRTG